MKKQLFLAIILFALSITIVAAEDLADYPKSFLSQGSFNGQIIVGNSAPATDVLAAIEISNSLQQLSESQMRSSTEDEFDPAKNSILIGLPCQNKAISSILGTGSCDIGLANNTGYIRLVEKNGAIYLIVTGKTAADTRKAARALAQYRLHAFLGNDMLVSGTLESPQLQRLTEPFKIQSRPECNADSDCPEDKWCSTGKCSALDCPAGVKAMKHDCIQKKQAAMNETPAKESPAPAAAGSIPAPQQQPPLEKQAKPSKGFFARILGFFKSILKNHPSETGGIIK